MLWPELRDRATYALNGVSFAKSVRSDIDQALFLSFSFFMTPIGNYRPSSTFGDLGLSSSTCFAWLKSPPEDMGDLAKLWPLIAANADKIQKLASPTSQKIGFFKGNEIRVSHKLFEVIVSFDPL